MNQTPQLLLLLHPHPTNNNKSSNAAIKWSCEDVKAWLIANNLENMSKVLNGFNGTALNSLFEMHQRDYTMFCNTIDKQIEEEKVKVKVLEKLNF